MKFAHSLKFNAVPEWQDNYVNYPTLKKTIYKLQQKQLEAQPSDGSIPVDDINYTTVSQLVEEHKIALNSVNKDTIKDEENKKFHPARLISRFKKNRSDSDSGASPEDLELGVGTTGNDFELEYKNSTHSFTVDFEDSNSSLVNFADEKHEDPKDECFDPLKVFAKQLLDEVAKVNKFYQTKEADIFKEYSNLTKDLEQNGVEIDEIFKHTHAHHQEITENAEHLHKLQKLAASSSVFGGEYTKDMEKIKIEYDDDEDDDDDDDDDDDELHSQNSALLSHVDFNVKEQKKITLKRKSVTVFISLSELKSFIELNKIGFTKITKKFDKTCNYAIKRDFIENYLPTHARVFYASTLESVDKKLDQLVKVNAFLSGKLNSKTTHQDLESVRLELKSHLRDHIVWERNTVWKDLLSIEKNSYNLQVDSAATHNKMGDEANVSNPLKYMGMKNHNLPWGLRIFGRTEVTLPNFVFTWQVFKIILVIVVFIILLAVKTFNDKAEHRCMALLAACAILWATEAIPLHTTAMLVPLLVVTCKVLKNSDGSIMDGADGATYIIGKMWSATAMLLMGGFTLAAALSKYDIAKILSSYILAFAGTKPRNILISIMCVSVFLSMWISNVAAPVLAFSLIQPVLRTQPTGSPFSKALVLGIALASDIAGMSSPISSPQNMVAIESMTPNPGWGKWFAVALPVTIICTVLVWLELIFTFKIGDAKIKAYKPIKEKFSMKQYYVSAVSILTIILWCVLSKIEDTFGNSGIISCIPIVLFFGTGLLKIDDLNNFPWGIILLAMGGTALGAGVTSSGLLNTIAGALQRRVMDFSSFVVLIIFGILVLVVATFVSHTVAALIIIPLVKEVGDQLPTPHPLLLIMGTALLASCAMGLPTSGFPNVTAVSMRDELGRPYISVNTFITRGVPASFICYIVVVTVGYGIMSTLDF